MFQNISEEPPILCQIRVQSNYENIRVTSMVDVLAPLLLTQSKYLPITMLSKILFNVAPNIDKSTY